MRNNIPRLLLMGALLAPSTPYALGLGEIRLNSALNQPFDAEIELLSPTPDELASLQVGLASNEMFARYGLDRPAFLSNFTFRVVRSPDGRTLLRVTSQPSVTEPFVTILVEASWSRGRLLREYTVLLDPPVFTPGPAAAPTPVAAPSAGAAGEGVIERPAAAPAPSPAPAPAAPLPAPAQALGDTYTVQRNDTLWSIASRIRPGSIRVVNQTMIALYRANPGAFNGNINVLRAGSVLRIPSAGEIEGVTQGEAAAEVAQQFSAWQGAAAAEGGRLRLVTPTEAGAPIPAPAPGGAPTPDPDAPLQQQVATLQEQLAETQRLLDLRNAELADLQQRLGEGVAPVAPAAPDAPAPSESATTAEPVPATEPTPAEPAPAVPAVAETPAPSLLDRLAQFWWALAGLGLAILIGIAVYFRSRRAADIDEAFDDASETMTPADFGASGGMAARSRPRDEAFLVEEGDEPVAVPAAPARKAAAAPAARTAEPAKSADDTLSSETAIRFDQQDALAEADFHMAYGLYDQAADLVKIAIEREPARRDLKLKLLEIYFVWGNKDLFLESARELHASRTEGEPGEWDKVLIMGRQISPENPMFQGGAGPAGDVVDLNLEGGENRVDVDLFGPGPADGKLDMEFGETHKDSSGDSGIDFLLDEPRRGSDEDIAREPDAGARTQETPTIESPQLADRASMTLREKVDSGQLAKTAGIDQTAELSLDDLGLDISSFEETGAPLDVDLGETAERPAAGRGEDEETRLAEHSFIGRFDPTTEAPRPDLDDEGTGTIVIDEGDTVERPRADTSATTRMKAVDFDLDMLSGDSADAGDTVRREGGPNAAVDDFSGDVFGADRTALVPGLDVDVGGNGDRPDASPSMTQEMTSMLEMPDLEPVTMSEVGTKLDLARAYMDMGDPDGARSILEEVLQEGSSSQKQEAERLLDSIR